MKKTFRWISDMFEWNKLRCIYVHFNNLFYTLKNLKYVVVHAVQVEWDELDMTYEVYIGLYNTNTTMEEKTWDNS